jgi:hypothetical protein
LIKSYYFVAGAFSLSVSVAVVALDSVVVVALGSVVVVALGSVVVAVSVLFSLSAGFSVLPPQEARENTNARTNKRFKNFMVEMF